jgi:hypothetical protein
VCMWITYYIIYTLCAGGVTTMSTAHMLAVSKRIPRIHNARTRPAEAEANPGTWPLAATKEISNSSAHNKLVICRTESAAFVLLLQG